MYLFNEFTNLYPVTRTLRFGLEPVGKTKQFLQKYLEKDKIVEKSYKELKVYFDELHKDFINQALLQTNLDLTQLFEEWILYKSTKDKQKQKPIIDRINIIKLNLRKQLSLQFTLIGNQWKTENQAIKFKKSGIEILFEASILSFLTIKYPLSTDSVKKFDGFYTYFTGFNENRKNYYNSEQDKYTGSGKSTSVITRVLDENIPLYFNNLITISKITEQQVVILISKAKLEEKAKIDFLFRVNTDYCNKLCTQPAIDEFNTLIGSFNKLLNEAKYELKNLDQAENKPIKSLTTLRNIIGFRNTKEAKIRSITNLNEYDFEIDKLMHTATIFTHENSIFSRFFEDIGKEEKWSGFALTPKALEKFARTRTKYTQFASVFGTVKTDKAEGITTFTIKNAKTLDELNFGINQNQIDYKLNTTEFSLLKIIDIIKLYQSNFIKQIEIIRDNLSELKRLREKDLTAKETITISVIKEIADSCIQIQHLIGDFDVKAADYEPDQIVISVLNQLENLNIVSTYNLLRNYLTTISTRASKWKLNFENGQFLGGWDIGIVKNKMGGLLKKDNKYYLYVLLNKNAKQWFDINKIRTLQNEDNFEYFFYKLLSSPAKDLAKKGFQGKNTTKFEAPADLLEIQKRLKSESLSIDSQGEYIRNKFIAYYQKVILMESDWKYFDFKLKKPQDYNSMQEFYTDISNQSYYLETVNIGGSFINSWVESGDALLFEISSKDFKHPERKSKMDLNTHYLLAALNPENTQKIKLNGEAELFYRQKVVEYDETKIYKSKSDKKFVGQKTYRYAKDSLHFHVSVTHNPHAIGTTNKVFNQLLVNKITDSQVAVIGIDRGERNLLYYSVVSNDGVLLDQGSLNSIDNGFDFYNAIIQKKKDRDDARKSWSAISEIKNLKNAYIGAVVHKLVTLMKQHNAVIAMESLNSGFKHSRSYLEESVYDKIEVALATKLQYLTEKNDESVINGLQLVPPIDKTTSISKGSQFGSILFVSPTYTSQTDPVTGWRPHIKFGSKVDEKRNQISKLKSVEYTTLKGFEFEYSEDDYGDSQTGRVWKLKSNIERLNNSKDELGHWHVKKLDLTQEFKELFANQGIKIELDIKTQLDEIVPKLETKALDSFIWLWNKLCQIRNSDKQNDLDAVISPVYPYFDSRAKKSDLPIDADANGAYNIARKGLIMLDKMKEGVEYTKLQITMSEWDQYTLKQNKLLK
jgi:RuvC nuclease domain/Alpha helical recognition lobe domain/Nuclease domain